MPGLRIFNNGFYSHIGANAPIATPTIKLGSTKGRGSSTRMYNWCRQHSSEPSLCINQFIPTPPAPVKQWTQLGNLTFNGPIDSILAINGKVYANNNILNSSQGYVVVYNNGSWSQVGTGNFTGPIYSIIGINNNLYASVAGTSNTYTNFVEFFNGNSWTLPPDASFNDAINTLAVNSSNGNIYAAGIFNTGSIGTNYVAQSTNNGSTWSQLGTTFNNEINTLAVNSSSGYVYAGGDFTDFTGKNFVAAYDGSSWSQIGNIAVNSSIESIVVGSNGYIYAAGFFTNGSGTYVAVYNGSSWAQLGNQSFNNTIWALSVDNNGNVYAGGDFTNSSGNRYIAVYNGSSWSQLGNDQLFGQTIDAIAVDNNGNVYADGYTGQLGNFVAVCSL